MPALCSHMYYENTPKIINYFYFQPFDKHCIFNKQILQLTPNKPDARCNTDLISLLRNIWNDIVRQKTFDSFRFFEIIQTILYYTDLNDVKSYTQETTTYTRNRL